MSNVNPLNSTPPALDFYAYPNALSADALLMYCRTQLNSIDNDVKSYLDEQRLNLARKKAVSEVENTMKKYTEHLTPEGQNEIFASYQEAIYSLPSGDPIANMLQTRLNELKNHTAAFTKEEMTSFVGDLHAAIEDINGGAEINMIQLQAMMSQRQTAVQLTTSLLSKFDEGTKSIVSNIGR